MSEFFSHLFGQERLKRDMCRLQENGRMPHTLLFYGEEGLGKTTAAFETADMITGYEGASCLEEKQLGSGFWEQNLLATFGNGCIWYIRPQKMELKIEQFHLFLEEMMVFDDRAHVCIIDEAQTMKPETGNVFLKTLEEPRANMYFILVTHDIEAILPTLTSRSTKLPFYSLSKAAYVGMLKQDAERYCLPSGVNADLAYELSEGNPGLTLEICQSTGDEEPETAMRFWETVTDSATPFTSLWSTESKERKAFLRRLRWIRLVGRDILLVAETGDVSFVRCRQVATRIVSIAPHWRAGKVELALSVLGDAIEATMRYISIKNTWDMILIGLEKIGKGDITWNK